MPAQEHIKTTKEYLQTLHPILVPLKMWSQIGIDLIAPLKECDSYKCIVTGVEYTRNCVEAGPLMEKTGVAVSKFPIDYSVNMVLVTYILQTKE